MEAVVRYLDVEKALSYEDLPIDKCPLIRYRIKSVYRFMIWRCNGQPDHDSYMRKGISVCQDWLYNFENFYLWAINNGYNLGLTIDRIDNDGNYCPKNCRWVTSLINRRNKKSPDIQI